MASCRLEDDPFNRPKIPPTIMGNCTGFKDGEMIDATNYIGVSPDEYNIIESYWDDKEFRLQVCLKFPRRCK